MIYSRKIFLCILTIIFTALIPILAMGATISLVPTGSSTYSIAADGLSGVAGIELSINYDTSICRNPRITKGTLVSGALMDSNAATQGLIRIAIITTKMITGSGQIGSITFDLAGSAPAKIVSLKGSLIDSKAKALAVQTSFNNPDSSTVSTATDSQTAGSTSTATSAAGTSSSTGTTSSATSSTTTASSVSSPVSAVPTTLSVQNGSTTGNADDTIAPPGAPFPSGSETSQPDILPPGAMPMPETGDAVMPPGVSSPMDAVSMQPSKPSTFDMKPSTAATATTAAVKPKSGGNKGSVLQLFKDFKGEKTIAAYTNLFDEGGMAGFRQDPAIVLSDGNATVKVYHTVPKGEKMSANFAFSGAKLISIRKGIDSTWIIEARPERNANNVVMTVLRNNMAIKYSPAVAQPIDANLDAGSSNLTEKDFNLFLSQRGTENVPRFDLNKDGKRDYVDDYIFTANYLVNKKKVELKKGTAPVR
jgi:hypothetical protein